jgi:localization factor PodJL
MKSGGPWNLRGLRPEARQAARDAARRSGMSVGEWLNGVIETDEPNYREQMRFADADYDDEDDEDYRPRDDYREPRRRPPPRRQRERDYRQEREPARRAAPDGDYRREREPASARSYRHEREPAPMRDATIARQEFGEVHARLDRLTQQLDRMAQVDATRLTGAPAQPQRGRPPAPSPLPPQSPRPRPASRPPALNATLAIDDAIAEINARQRTLYGEAVSAMPAQEEPTLMQAPVPLPPRPAPPAEPPVDISNLGEQLRHITTRIESLRPTSDFERVITAIRTDLAEIRRQITEALPRHAVESLEIEVQALARRIDHSRESGVDLGVLAGLEYGLAEVRDALRGLTPAESLVGFDETVRTLAQKVDMIVAKEDPAALQQLETAIGALRGIVSHVASNDTLTKVAEDVRALAGKVDDFANSAASGHAVSMIESRLDTLTNALHASTEAGQAVPRELEKMLGGLIEKLEWVQLTQTDHAALGHLEDRIAQLIKRLDASDARLGNLEAVERGLADLLVHLDHIRGGNVAEIKRSERRTQDSLEAVHGTVEHVVDRLAMIESGINEGAPPVPAVKVMAEPAEVTPPAAPMFGHAHAAPIAAPKPIPVPETADAGAPRTATPRQPIDPNLPPDHPLEPGSSAGPRATSSPADRIAASEAAAGYAKVPVSRPPAEKPNFIAAARRAAQAAAASPERQSRAEIVSMEDGQPTSRVRKLLVAGGAVLVAFGCMHIALHMFQDGGPSMPPRHADQAAAPTVLNDNPPAKQPGPSSGPLVLPVPNAPVETAPSAPQVLSPSDTSPSFAPKAPSGRQGVLPAPSGNAIATPAQPAAIPATPAPPDIATMPSRQSSLHDPADVTGSLPRRVPPPAVVAPAQVPPPDVAVEKLPATPAAPVTATMPSRPSALHDPADVTAALPRRAPPPVQPVVVAPAQVPPPDVAIEKLPATIGGPTLRAAALAGDAPAEFEIAMRFAEGHDVAPSNEEAARWMSRAAKQGLPLAQFRLGGFYEKGIGVKKDLAAARDLYLAAANKGNGKAMHNLAVLYAEGIDGPADYRTASRWFRKAADHGITDSQYNLAILYARGIGVEQNYAESYKWFALAANAGDTEAGKKRDEVTAHLDAQSLAAAQAAVQKFTAEPQPDDAINVKLPPGGWDPPPQAAKPKPRTVGARAVVPETKVN